MTKISNIVEFVYATLLLYDFPLKKLWKVAVRVRPLTHEERSDGDTHVVYRVDDKMVVVMDPGEDLTDVLRHRRTKEKRYTFDVAFGPEAAQKEVYGSTTHQLVESILQGYNATVFAYGATGAGKTFTMVGTEKNPGIMVRALDDLFSMIQTFDKSELRYSVKMSYMEYFDKLRDFQILLRIYNEIIRDLLRPSSDIIDIREDSAGMVQVAGLSEVQATSSKEVLNLLLHGNMRRTQEPTAANKTSSRSHAILQVTVVQSKKVSDGYVKNRKTVGRLFLIDLAGSERASHTKNTGQRLKEGAHINRSLLALGNVINTLTEKGAKFVNYRDSKLTRLLKDSLGGHNRTVMIANISPASSQYEESKTTLIYANRAKNITNNVSKNNRDLAGNDTQYQSIVSELRKEIERLRLKIDKQNRIIQTLPPIHRSESAQSFNSTKNDASHTDMNSPLILAQSKLSKGTDSLPPVKLSDEYMKLKGEFIVLFQEQLRLRHQLTECNDKAYQLKFQIAKKEIELKLLNDSANRNFYQSSSLRNSVDAAKIKLKELESRKRNIESEIAENGKKAKGLEQSMPDKINTAEQREMWSLLFRLHDSEIDKAVLQADALLLNRRLDRQENSLEKVANNTYIGKALVEEQKKILTASRIPLSQKALELYKTFENSSKEVVIAQKTLKATNQAELEENRQAIADRIQHSSEDSGFSKTLTYSELQKLKRQSNAMNALSSTDSNISRLAVRRGFDDENRNIYHHRTKANRLFSKTKAQKRYVQVGWKSPVIDRSWSISSHNEEESTNDEKTRNSRGKPSPKQNLSPTNGKNEKLGNTTSVQDSFTRRRHMSNHRAKSPTSPFLPRIDTTSLKM